MAKAHTGHLTGSDAVISAVFRQFGVTRVDGLDELLDVAAALARTAPPSGDGVCVYSISGGTGAHMADMVAAAGLRVPELSTSTQEQLHERLLKLTPAPCPELEAAWEAAAEAVAEAKPVGAVDPGVAQFLVLVTCRDEKQQVELLERFRREGLECKALLS